MIRRPKKYISQYERIMARQQPQSANQSHDTALPPANQRGSQPYTIPKPSERETRRQNRDAITSTSDTNAVSPSTPPVVTPPVRPTSIETASQHSLASHSSANSQPLSETQSTDQSENNSSSTSTSSNESEPAAKPGQIEIDPVLLNDLLRNNPGWDISNVRAYLGLTAEISSPNPPLEDSDLPGPSGLQQANRPPSPKYASECAFCFSTLEHGDFKQPENRDRPIAIQLANCNHVFCYPCLSHHLTTEQEKLKPSIKCPFPECDIDLLQSELQEILGDEKLNVLLTKLTEQQIGSDVIYCPACREAFTIDPGSVINKSESFLCPKPGCGARSCLACEVTPYHVGKTCEEARRARMDAGERTVLEEAESSAHMAKMEQLGAWVQCPNRNCNIRIERTYGCNHMTCKKCRHEFCYVCKGNWQSHKIPRRFLNDAHYYSCPFCPLCKVQAAPKHKNKYVCNRHGGEYAFCGDCHAEWGTCAHCPLCKRRVAIESEKPYATCNDFHERPYTFCLKCNSSWPGCYHSRMYNM